MYFLNLKQTAALLDLNLRGRCFNEHWVVIQSDDWGSIRVPQNSEALEILHNRSNKLSIFQKFDTLDGHEDWFALVALLDSIQDRTGKKPVFTSNFVTGNPNFEQIKSHQFTQFFWDPFYLTYEQLNSKSVNTLEIIKHGISKGVIEPQYHGRQHVNHKKWLKSLSAGDENALDFFRLNMWIYDSFNSNSLRSLNAVFDSSDYTREDVELEFNEGIQVFNQAFGQFPESFIPNNYFFNREWISILSKYGIKSVQGMKYGFETNLLDSAIQFRRYNQKEKLSSNLVNLVRNVVFDPSVDLLTQKHYSVNWAKDQIKMAFALKKPIIIDSHRVNYVGGIDANNRNNGIEKLGELLNWLVHKYPKVRFTSTAELATLYS